MKKKISAIVISVILLLLWCMPAQAYNSFNPSINWNIIPTAGNEAIYAGYVYADDENNIYLFYTTQASGYALKQIKFNQSTQTWSSPQYVNMGGVRVDYLRHAMRYINGTFYLVDYYWGSYLRYGESGDGVTFSRTDVDNQVTYAALKVSSDGRVAIGYNKQQPNGYYVYHNYGGSFTKTTVATGLPYYMGYVWNNGTGFRGQRVDVYDDFDDYYTDTIYWDNNAGTWGFNQGTTYSSNSSYPGYGFMPNLEVSVSLGNYYNAHSIWRGSGVAAVANYSYDSDTYRCLVIGNYISLYNWSQTEYNMRVIGKLNEPDGRFIVFGGMYSGSNYYLSYSYVDHIQKQQLSLIGKTITSLTMRFAQGQNTNLSRTYTKFSLNDDMETTVKEVVTNNSQYTGTNYDITADNLVPSTGYYVQNTTTDGTRTVSTNPILVYTLPAIPGTPEIPSVDSTQVQISFDTSNNGEGTVYEVERSMSGNPSGSDWNSVYIGEENTCIDTGLAAKTTYYYRVRSRNLSNEWSDYSSIKGVQTLAADTVAPVVSLKLNNGKDVISSSMIAVELIAADNRTAPEMLRYSYSINNGEWTPREMYSSTSGILNMEIEHGLLSSGSVVVQFRVYDTDNNAGIASGRVYYQNSAEKPEEPVINSIVTAETGKAMSQGVVNGNNVYFSNTGSIVIDMSEIDCNSYQVAINGADYGPAFDKQEPLEICLGFEGIHVIKVRQVNSIGVGGVVKTLRVAVDKTPPNVRVSVLGEARATSNDNISILIDGNDNMTNLRYRINGGAWSALPTDKTVIATLAMGLNNIGIDIADCAENYSKFNIKVWRL